jgi:hypothetical protein
MTDGRRLTEPNAFLDAFAATLLAAGVDVARVTTSVPILHPQIFFFNRPWIPAFAGMRGVKLIAAFKIGVLFYGCTITLPIALRLDSTAIASAVLASGKVA